MPSPEAPLACALREPNKTLAWQDLREPPVARMRRRLARFLRAQYTLRGAPVAVNGVLRRRAYVRRLKMWEYARGLVAAPVAAGGRLLDFGGGATLPPAWCAAQGAQTHVLDIDARLAEAGAARARARGWPLTASTVDLTQPDAAWPDGWPVGAFDAVHSYCVLEHIPSFAAQDRALARLADALAPGGRMVLSFEYGADAPGEAPWRDAARIDAVLALLADHGLRALGDGRFHDCGYREALDRRHPQAAFTFGMLVLASTP